MASYLGKISALVTANTGPFRSALNATKQDLNQWRNEVNRTLNTAAAGNWEKKILLPIQQIERAIRDANREPLSIGIDEAMVSRIRQMARLTEGIAEPLAQAVGQFKSMGGAIQTALLPALQRVQNAALEMKNEISEGTAKSEADFARLESSVESFTKSLGRAREAQSLLSSMATGKELRFTNPTLVAAMSGASSAQQRASAVLTSRDQIDISAELYAYQRTLAEAAIEIDAHIEAERALGRNTDILSREQRRLIGELQKTTSVLEEQIVRHEAEAASIAAQKQADRELADAKEYEAKIRREFASKMFLTQLTPEEAFADSRQGRAAAESNRQTSERMRLNVSASMNDAIRQFEAMSAASRSVFAPSVKVAQDAVDLLAKKIQAGGFEGARVFADLEGKVNRLAAALSAAGEAQSMLSSMATGREMIFANQPLFRAIASASSSQAAATAGIDSAAQAKALGSLYDYQRSLAQAAVEVESQIRAARLLGESTESLSAKQRELIAELERSTKMLNDRVATLNKQREFAEAEVGPAIVTELPPGFLQQQAIRNRQRAIAEAEVGPAIMTELPPGWLQQQADRKRQREIAEEREADQARRREFANQTQFKIIDHPPTFAGRLRQEAAEAERRRGAAFDAVGFGRGIPGISQSLNQQELSGRIGQLQALRRGLAGVAAEASGPAVRAISRLRDVIAEAFDQGTLDSAPVRRNIEALTAEAVAATARASGVSENKVRRDVRRAGDIARGGFDKLGLGLQQAVFAFEDFFSVTGGLDQRLRAAGNNISQLGFLMGGLGGLVAGVSVAIGGQLAVALYKYLNSGVASEDQTRSLTAALDEQKRKAEDLKSVFDSLGKAMADATLSPTGRSEAEQRRGVQAAIDAIKAARDAKIFALDPGVQRASGVQVAAERRLSQATTPAQAATALGEIEQAKAAVEAAKAAAVARATATVLPLDQFNAQVQRIRDEARAARAMRAAGAAGGLNVGGAGVGGLGEGQGGNGIAIRQAEARIAEMVADRNRQEDFQRFEALLAGGAMRGLNFANAGAKNAALGLGLIQQAFGGDARTSEILRRMDLVSSDRALAVNALGSAATSPIFGDAGNATIVEANRVQAALNGAAKAMQGFADISGKVSQSISADVSTLEQRSEKLRRESLAGLPGAMEDASRAAEVAANARSLQQEASDTLAVARKRVEQQVLGEDNARLGQIEIAIQSPNIKAETLDALLAERRQIMANREVAMEADPGVQAAMELRDQASAMAERAAMADRGRELSMTPGQRAARDLGRKLEEVRQDFQDRDPNNVAGQQQAMRRVFNDAARQAAPMVFGFADEVLTARLQGPSREPLNFTDVATMEGQREFNRLLRRDDPSRDVNLSELQKQTGYLAEIANTARNFGVGVAN